MLRIFLPLPLYIFAILLAVLVTLPACSTDIQPSTRSARILWPPPPNKPQLEFINTYSSNKDFQTSFWEKLLPREELALNAPFGTVSDGKGKVYVSDLRDGNIKIFDFNKKMLSIFSGLKHVEKPLGMAIDEAGNIYVVEGGTKKILVFAPDGTWLRSFGGVSILEKPIYLAINNMLGRIYVSDSNKHRIAVFDRDGKHLFYIGKKGIDNGEFGAPKGLAVDRDGRLFVADMLNARIQVFTADGKFLFAFGKRGNQRWQFESPRDISVASDGTLYILDHFKALMLTYTPEGELLLFTGGDKRTEHPLGFSTPTSVFIDSTDRIYIADQTNNRISVWQFLSTSYLGKNPITQKDLDNIQKSIEK